MRALSAKRTSNVETGKALLRDLIEISRTTRDLLNEAQARLEAIPDVTIQRLIGASFEFLQKNTAVPKIESNWNHVEEQLLRPIVDDSDELEEVFGISPLRLRLLVAFHDLGKVSIPEDMEMALFELFPDDLVAREILTHEYASMFWIAELCRAHGLGYDDIIACQRLIANHNFGPDLCAPEHLSLRNNWWPSNFRAKIIPRLPELGLDAARLYQKSEDGCFQYNHTEDNVYAALLSVYDRAISTDYNLMGLETWRKFAEQNYRAWSEAVKKQPGLPSPFNAVLLTEAMEQAAKWASDEVTAMWRVLERKHVLPGRQGIFKIDDFPPYVHQRWGINKLLEIIQKVKQGNGSTPNGGLTYRTKDGSQFIVQEQKQNERPRARLSIWDAKSKGWILIAEDENAVVLYFQVLKADL